MRGQRDEARWRRRAKHGVMRRIERASSFRAPLFRCTPTVRRVNHGIADVSRVVLLLRRQYLQERRVPEEQSGGCSGDTPRLSC